MALEVVGRINPPVRDDGDADEAFAALILLAAAELVAILVVLPLEVEDAAPPAMLVLLGVLLCSLLRAAVTVF